MQISSALLQIHGVTKVTCERRQYVQGKEQFTRPYFNSTTLILCNDKGEKQFELVIFGETNRLTEFNLETEIKTIQA